MVRDALETLDDALPSTAVSDIDGNGFDEPGRSFCDYELQEEISRGGMGVVYKGRQKSINRLVAIKILLVHEQTDPTLPDRLSGEARAAASLQHPNIVGVHDFGVCEGRHYLTMDYVDGPNLHELCAKDPLAPQRAAHYVKTIAEAIHYAHQQGVLHRDLKPSNVLIDQLDQPRITDFGLAKSLATDAHLTMSGQTLGTPQYLPPEQASVHRGQGGPWSDVYSIGGILYHLLTGRPPFVGGQVGDVLQQVLHSDPVPPRVLNPSVPLDLETICLKCLEKEPRRRYSSARELADELDLFLNDQPILSRPVGRVEKAWRWCRRKPLVAGLLLALSIASVAGVTGVVWQWRRAVAGELVARQNAYDGDMILIQQALSDGDLGHARELLNRQLPQPSQLDLRNWEWRYRWKQSQPDSAFRRSLYQHTSGVSNVQVSPGGNWLALSGADGMIAKLDLASGAPTILQSPNNGAAVMAMSAKGDLLAFSECCGWSTGPELSAAEEKSRLVLWDVVAARALSAFEYTGRILTLAFSADGNYLVTLAIDKTWTKEVVAVWEIARQSPVSSCVVANTPPGTYQETMAVSPSDNVLAVGDATGRIHVLSLPELKSRLEFPAHGEMVTALAFSPDGRTIASGAGFSDSSVRLWDATTGKAIADPLVGHQRYVHALTFSPDKKTLASAGADQSIRLWDTSTGESTGVLRGHGQEVWALAYLPDGDGLVSACKDGSVWLWEPSMQKPNPTAALTADGVWQFAFLPDAQRGAVVAKDCSVQLWDVATLTLLQPLPDLGSNNWMVTPSSDGRFLASATKAGRVQVWDLQQQCVLSELTVASERTTTWAKFANSNRQLFTVGIDFEGQVTRWDTATWETTGKWRLGNTPCTGDVSLSGRLVVAGLTDGSLAILDCVSNRQSLLNDGTGIVTAAAFSPDEGLLGTGDDQGRFRLWSSHAKQPYDVASRGHLMVIPSIAFSPNGKRVVTAGSSGEEAVLLWDVATRRLVATLQGEGSRFIWVTFSPDGNSIAAVTRDSGRLHLWRAPSFTEIEAQGNH